jgi:hypothetical protein
LQAANAQKEERGKEFKDLLVQVVGDVLNGIWDRKDAERKAAPPFVNPEAEKLVKLEKAVKDVKGQLDVVVGKLGDLPAQLTTQAIADAFFSKLSSHTNLVSQSIDYAVVARIPTLPTSLLLIQ